MPPKKPTPVTKKRVQREEKEPTAKEARKKARKIAPQEDQEEEADHVMMEEKSEEAAPPTTTAMDPQMSKISSSTSSSTVADTIMTTANLTEPFIPHGILKLPQSIASALAADHLKKLEIRDLGLTCRWMLVSLNQCIIREPISLQTAARRLERQRASVSTKVWAHDAPILRKVVGRIPNAWIGRFQNVRITPTKLTQTELNNLKLLSQLIDTRKLILCFNSWQHRDKIKKDFEAMLPLALPVKLNELVFERGHSLHLLSLSKFILPSSLQSIRWDVETFFFSDSMDLTRVQWPKPSGLKTLFGIPDSSTSNGLILPDGLSKVTFEPRGPSDAGHITNITLPISITNLDIKWSDVTGRYYHNLPFPPQLKRLVLHCELSNDDFNLNEWVHLPKTCTNIRLTLTEEYTFFGSVHGSSSPVVITIPEFVVCSSVLYFLRQYRSRSLRSHSQRSRLNLIGATSLTALETNTIDNIDWPSVSSTPVANGGTVGLSSKSLALKLRGRTDALISHATTITLPLTITSIDLSELDYWYDFDLFRSSQLWTNWGVGTNLLRLKVIDWCDSPLIRQTVVCWSRALTGCIVEFSLQPGDTRTTKLVPSKPIQLSVYQNGRLIQSPHTRTLDQAKEWTVESERYDRIPCEVEKEDIHGQPLN